MPPANAFKEARRSVGSFVARHRVTCRITRRLALGMLGAAATGAGALQAADRPRVIRALVESWAPYLIPGADGTMRGLDADLLQAICKQAGFHLNWVRGPQQWRRRRFRELLNDQFDVIFSATPAPAHERVVLYSRPYRSETFLVAAADRRDARLDRLHGFEDVLRRHVPLLHVDALRLGTDFETWRPRLAEAGLLIPYQTARQGLDMMRLGRAPLILGDELELMAQAKLSGQRLNRQPFGYSVQPVSLMLSRRRLDEADVARLDQSIHALEQRGALAAIRRRYGAA
jgi:polar amino acid transport system substrate-binding protein